MVDLNKILSNAAINILEVHPAYLTSAFMVTIQGSIVFDALSSCAFITFIADFGDDHPGISAITTHLS